MLIWSPMSLLLNLMVQDGVLELDGNKPAIVFWDLDEVRDCLTSLYPIYTSSSLTLTLRVI